MTLHACARRDADVGFEQNPSANAESTAAAQAAGLTNRVFQRIGESRRHIDEAIHAQNWPRARAPELLTYCQHNR